MCEFFTGLTGSGKTTELLRLIGRLRGAQDGVSLLPVYIDAEQVIDLTSPIDVPDIRLAILYQTEQAILEAEGRPPAAVMEEGYLARLWNYLSKTEVELPRLEGPGLGGKLIAELKTRPTLRRKVRSFIAEQTPAFLREVDAELVEMDRRAMSLGFGGLVVIFDSLEKLRGLSSNWHEVLGSAERVFAGGAPYLRLPVHALYSIPPALVLRIRDASVRFMPMIKLFDQQGHRFDPGFEAARVLIRHRIPNDAIIELLGPESEERLNTLIEWSGGYAREIVRLLRLLLEEEQQPLPKTKFNQILNLAGDDVRRVVPANAMEWLAQVAVRRILQVKDDAHREIVDLMLTNNVVLRYQNESEWFDLHPAVRMLQGMDEAIARVTAGRSMAD